VRPLYVLALTFGIAACGIPRPSETGSADAAFNAVASRVIDAYLRRHPATATDLGVHSYDDALEDYSAAAVGVWAATVKAFRAEVEALSPATLSEDCQIDREFLLHALDAELLQAEVIRPWARDPDVYTSGLTSAAHVLITRNFAAPEVRLEALLSRLRVMPAALAEARKNLTRPPRVYTEIAIQQIDGNRQFFLTAVRGAFKDVPDGTLQADLGAATSAVASAFADYKRWLESDLLGRSDGDFAYGAETYRRRLLAEEMIDVPLDELLAVARADLARNRAAFTATARLIAPGRTPADVLADLATGHPAADRLLAATEAELDSIAEFIRSRRIISLPPAARVRVVETPPFLRATTTASMDTPGPFETRTTDAFYNMTLPDPGWPAADRRAFMEQWYYPAITNVSVHEVWPGHYLQFSLWRGLSSDVRKAFRAASNVDGWAHYAEQMMIDEGFHASDPRYRLAQLQDALLRNVRFIVGIGMHTRGMTMAEAERMFVEEAYQPLPVARAETRRGTSDATYGYYTMGKLMLLKLRQDYEAKVGRAFSLQSFHDRFIALGPLPLPLIRRAMLGEKGALF
jgi:uncharacterized protein (DUF885 family)